MVVCRSSCDKGSVYVCVLQSEHVDHVDSDSYIQVVTATHSLYLSLQVNRSQVFFVFVIIQ